MHRWSLGAVGDVFLNRRSPEEAFARVENVLSKFDLLFGNCEGVYTDAPRSVPTASGFRVIAPLIGVSHLRNAGFDVLSCANNHTVDAGHEALLEMLGALEKSGIRAPGAGADVRAARACKQVRCNGVTVAFVALSCVYPAGYEARDRTPGIAAVRVHTHYFVHPESFGRVEPGADPTIRTAVFPEDRVWIRQCIADARQSADVVIVSMHWGKSVRPAMLMDYEVDLGRALIDWGADVVFGHHHHMLRGIEIHQGKPIFYGLGHFAFDMPGLEETLGSAQLERLRRAGEYAIYPRDGYPLLPFHPDARLTMIAACEFEGARVVNAGFVPCELNRENQPVFDGLDGPSSARVLDYMEQIMTDSRIPTRCVEGRLGISDLDVFLARSISPEERQ